MLGGIEGFCDCTIGIYPCGIREIVVDESRHTLAEAVRRAARLRRVRYASIGPRRRALGETRRTPAVPADGRLFVPDAGMAAAPFSRAGVARRAPHGCVRHSFAVAD